MARARKATTGDRESAPGRTLEARENQLILLATNLAEQWLRDGTAPAQVVSHYLKLGSTRERLEQERIRHENELASAKSEKIRSDRQSAEMLEEALKAFRSYSGRDEEDDYYED